ncbi:hypothetical protein RHMOL_Rhmol12G0125700 [Rhododendron molle]|uniref:Uncharacterized protein n=1 Tax=Rhododendron molle TaxID=49168 RepID=A0ACC0LHM0_RHOML|nr:hypothetical protein RHMOL_Rhmol12G0125700 [Rhododendron molle]
MALALSMSSARLSFQEMTKMNIGAFGPSSSSSAKGRSLQPLHCTPLQQIEHQEHGAIAVDSYVISENIGQKTNVKSANNRIYRRCPSCKAVGCILCAKCKVFKCVTFPNKLTNKGPMLWPVMGIIPSLFFHFNHIHDWATKALIKTNGTFNYKGMWMGGSHGIITSDPLKIEYMLKTNFKNFPKGKYYRERFHDLLGDGIFNVDGESWKEQRKAAISELHATRFVEYSVQTVQALVHQKLLEVAENVVKLGNCIDLQELLLRFTFDNICIAAFGINPGCLSTDFPEVAFAKAFEEATELTLIRFMVPSFVWKPIKFFQLGFEKRLKEAVRVVHDFAEKTVRDRRVELSKTGSLENKSDLLSRLMESGKGQNSRFTDKLLMDFCISFILAGRDTSSVALAWFFWLIDKNPQVENRILYELNGIINQRMGKKEVDTIVFTGEELKTMVYLEAAISEALRLYPPVPIDFKEVTIDDFFADGTFVKKGARVIYSLFSMARMESVWGKDCLEFKPERWIKNGKFVSENQFRYPVFNAGPRLCVGKNFAYMQMKMVAASVLLRYSVKVAEGQNAVPKVVQYCKMSQAAVDVPMKGGFNFDHCRRNEMLSNKGFKPPSFLKTGTTIVGLIFEVTHALTNRNSQGHEDNHQLKAKTGNLNEFYVNGFSICAMEVIYEPMRGVRCFSNSPLMFAFYVQDGVILGADTRATEGPIVADKNCEKIHYMAPNIYCCGAGTAADTEAVTDMVSSQLQLHRYHTSRESRVVTALSLLKSHLFSYQGHVSAALVLGGVDVTGPHLHTIYPHGSTDTLPFATMGSGSLAAMAVFESKYHEGLTRDEGIKLVTEAICSGIFNDLGSGSNVDVCVITKGQTEYLRNLQSPNPRTYTNEKGYTFSKKTEVLLTKITPLKEMVEVIEGGGDAMEE